MSRASVIGAWVVAAASLAADGGAGEPPTPKQMIEQLEADVVSELGTMRAELEADPERFYELAKRRLGPHFDLESSARYILGPAGSAATAAERAAFRNAFEDYLVTSYASALRYVTPDTLTVTGEPRASGNDVLLPIRILLVDGDTLEADLRLRLGPSGWRIWDAAGGGISVVKMYRGDFGTEATVHGIDHAIQSLRAAIARNRARDRAETLGRGRR